MSPSFLSQAIPVYFFGVVNPARWYKNFQERVTTGLWFWRTERVMVHNRIASQRLGTNEGGMGKTVNQYINTKLVMVLLWLSWSIAATQQNVNVRIREHKYQLHCTTVFPPYQCVSLLPSVELAVSYRTLALAVDTKHFRVQFGPWFPLWPRPSVDTEWSASGQ